MNLPTKWKRLFTVLLMSCSVCLLQAQPGPGDPGGDPGGGPGGPGNPGDPGGDPGGGDTNVPFDGGLSLLVGAGICYAAARKRYDKRKKDKATDKTEEGEL